MNNHLFKNKITAITPVGKTWNPVWLRKAGTSIKDSVGRWIVVCDGSNPLEVMEALQEFPKEWLIVIGSAESQGQAYARNLGLEYVETPFVYAIDADDYIDVEAFSRFATNFIDSGYAWGASQSYDVLNDDVLLYYPGALVHWNLRSIIPQGGFLDYYIDKGNYPILCSGGTLLKTSIAKQLHGWDVELKNISEDVSLIANISELESGYWNGNESVLRYRKHNTSTTYIQNLDPEFGKKELKAMQAVFKRARPDYNLENLVNRLKEKYMIA